MKKLLSILLVLNSILIFATAFAKESSESLDQIVAVINDDVVTRTEVSAAMARIKLQAPQEQISKSVDLQKQVIEQLVNRKLQLQMAQQVGIRVSDKELDNAIQMVATQNQSTVSELYRRLQQEHLTVSDYRKEIRDQMTLQKIQQQEVAGKVSVSPDEIKHFMRLHPLKPNPQNIEYHFEDILIPLPESPSQQQLTHAQQKANQIIFAVKKGKSFSAFAQQDKSLQKIELGWRKIEDMPSAFIEQAAAMQRHDIAGPIQTSNGLHVIYLTESRGIGQNAQTDQKQVENILLQKKFEEAIQTWVSKLRAQAYIVVNSNSHDVT
jgi:peptidyl-prolyl cis-trans isomerase SurA